MTKTRVYVVAWGLALLPFAARAAGEFVPFFEGRNALANAVLTPGLAPVNGVGAALPEQTVPLKCPVCAGRGTLTLTEPNHGQLDGRLGKPRVRQKPCPLCQGRGAWRAWENPADRARRIARDYAAFAASHQGRGDVKVGQAYVPRSVYDAADRRLRKQVEEAFGKLCAKCDGSGLEACRKCRGEGTVACGEKDCKGGWQVTKTTTTTSRSGGGIHTSGAFHSSRSASHHTTKREVVTVTECAACGGAGRRLCPECGGMRARPCKKCNGMGMKGK